MAAGSDAGSKTRAGELPRRGNENSVECVRKKTEMFADRKENIPFPTHKSIVSGIMYTAIFSEAIFSFYFYLFHVDSNVIDWEQKKNIRIINE